MRSVLPNGPTTLPRPQRGVAAAELLPRICVRAPYFALSDLAQDGAIFSATARAESPPLLERGPMPAAELGRHAAIVGLSHGALEQGDDDRRYYLARRARCRYRPSDAPYGAPIRFRSRILDLDRRALRVAVEATLAADGSAVAAFEIDYNVLTARAFERLFAGRRRELPSAPASPYGSLLADAYERTGDGARQRIEAIPAAACAGHFEHHPALPVAVLMGQLSYLAGRLVDDEPCPFRVRRGDVEASDLGWAGEEIVFEARRARFERSEEVPDGDDAVRVFRCEARVDGTPVGAMRLELEPLPD